MPLHKMPEYGKYWLQRKDHRQRWAPFDIPTPLHNLKHARREAMRLARRAEWRGCKFAILSEEGVEARAAVFDFGQSRGIWTYLSKEDVDACTP